MPSGAAGAGESGRRRVLDRAVAAGRDDRVQPSADAASSQTRSEIAPARPSTHVGVDALRGEQARADASLVPSL